MAVTLPTDPAAASATLSLRRFGVDLTPPLGGPVQRASRLGTRFAVQFAYAPLTKAQFEDLLGALLQADTDQTTVIAELPQDALAVAVGAPLVNGAGQLGATLNADAFTASVAIPRGTAFSFQAGGRHYLHMLKAAAAASGGGVAALAVGPMLRASPADNAALQFAAPKVEGFVEGDDITWSLDVAGHYHLSFTIFENE